MGIGRRRGSAASRTPFAPRLASVALGATAASIYGCVPETDQMDEVGAMVAGLVVLEVLMRPAIHPLVNWVAGVIVLWSGLYGATGRDSAIVGTLFAFWPVVIVPIVTTLQPAWRERPELDRWMIMALGAVAAVTVARTGAIQPTVGPALVAVAIAAPVSLAVPLAIMAVHRRRAGRARAAGHHGSTER